MSTAHVDFDLTLPSDLRYEGVLREALVSAARAAGCRESEVDALGRSVEHAASTCAKHAGPDGVVSVIVRRGSGTLDIRLACDGFTRLLSIATVE